MSFFEIFTNRTGKYLSDALDRGIRSIEDLFDPEQNASRQGEHRGQRRGMTHGEESKRCFLEVAPYVSRSVPGMDALPWWKNAAS